MIPITNERLHQIMTIKALGVGVWLTLPSIHGYVHPYNPERNRTYRLLSYAKLLTWCSSLCRYKPVIIGIDHDTVCAGVVGTAIRNSTSCAGRCAAACGRAGRHNECCSGLQYQPRQRRPFKWSISILPRSQFTKSKGNLRSRRLVPLFVPIGVCVTTHDDGTASDVTIGMWRHNQQVTNHERNGKPWFSLPK